jgi:hypothetical protein
MIIKSLLFIIICIFVYETLQMLNKMTEEYFTNMLNNKQTNYTQNINQNINQNKTKKINYNKNTEQFVNLSKDPDKNDISKTIAINCKDYPPNKPDKIMVYKPEPDESLDTTLYSRFKPLEYNPKRRYFWSNDKLIEEGLRRTIDDNTEIEKVQNLLDNETDPDKQQMYEEELSLFNWRKNILSLTDSDTGIARDKQDITTDYFLDEIGMNRVWIERHSHIPDYSY